jgi:hypothetical protein
MRLVPRACDGFGSVQESKHGLRIDLRNIHRPKDPRKEPKVSSLGVETHSLHPFKRDVFFD